MPIGRSDVGCWIVKGSPTVWNYLDDVAARFDHAEATALAGLLAERVPTDLMAAVGWPRE